jgi:two-component system cell cycle response regulator DivK
VIRFAGTVLVVDDNPLNLELVDDVLTAAGFTVRLAGSGEEALRSAREQPPDLMLLDIGLPGMDGYAAVRALKADPKTREIVVVALTAFAMPQDEARAREAGFDAYVSKPVQTRTLSETVGQLIDARRHIR